MSDQPQVLLSCRNVVKRYGALTVVDGLDMDVHEGEVLGISGPNGAGKTTLFDMISGVSTLSEGTVTFQQQDISLFPAHKLCPLGLARTFQLNAVFDSLSVEDNVLCAAYFGHGVAWLPRLVYSPRAKENARLAMSTAGLEKIRNKRAGGLTVLERKQLMIACALATQPRLLLLDEPVGGLNPREIDQTIQLIKKIGSEWSTTIVLIEHVMRFVVALCDRAVIMHRGRKIYDGPTSGLAKDRSVVEVYLGRAAADRLQRLIVSSHA